MTATVKYGGNHTAVRLPQDESFFVDINGVFPYAGTASVRPNPFRPPLDTLIREPRILKQARWYVNAVLDMVCFTISLPGWEARLLADHKRRLQLDHVDQLLAAMRA